MNFSAIEYHTIQLKSITALLDSVLNHIVLDIRGSLPDIEIHFANETNQMLYNIVLVDLFSKFDRQIVGDNDMNGLDILRNVGDNPLFNEGNAKKLQEYVKVFNNWLTEKITVNKLWFPSINLETSLTIMREDYIYICGNISKHCFPRLTGVAKRIMRIFEENSHRLDISDALTIIPEFYDWFHTNIFAYSATNITEMLNNIRWGVQEYLFPVYQKCIRYIGNDGRYKFDIPSEITTGYGKSCFWDLMNEIRRKPYLQKFNTPWYLKQRY